MGWWQRTTDAVATLLRKDRVERELDDEIAFHVEQEAAKLLRQGMAPDDARREALRRFGGLERTKEQVRDERGVRPLEDLIQDARYGLRTLAHNPGYTLVVLVTLGLGIGANTAIFSVVSGVLLDPLPYEDGEELVYLRQSVDAGDIAFSVLDIQDLREGTRAFDEMVEYHGMTFTLLGEGEPEEVSTGVVSHNFFRALGTAPVVGRDFTAEDDGLGAEPVLVLSHGYWLRRFGGDPSVVGRTFEMNGKTHTVIGVLPPVPQFPAENDVYMPTSACPIRSSDGFRETRNARMMAVFGRVRDGLGVEAAGADVNAAAARLREAHPAAYPAERGHRVATTPLKEELVHQARPTLLVLLGTAGFVLLIACANVANLALARMTRREQELAVRSAMGAGRGRLARQLLTESTLLAVGGGVLGLAVAWMGMEMLVDFAGRFTPRAAEAAMDGPVLAFALVVALVTGLGFGSLPAVQVRHDVSRALREGTGASASRGRGRMQNILVVVQLAFTVMLMVGAGLLVRSFLTLQARDPGYDPTNVLAMQVTVNNRNTDWEPERRKQFYLDVVERIQAHPAVVAAAVTNSLPMGQAAGPGSAVRSDAAAGVEVGRLPRADVRVASPGFFEATGIELLRGRFFDAGDREDTELVAVINESLASELWPGQDPLGRTATSCSVNSGACDDAEAVVVGVFRDVLQYGLDQPAPNQVYVSSLQQGFPGMYVLVRTDRDPAPLAADFSAIVHELGPTVPVSNVRTLEAIQEDRIASRRLTMVLLAIFAGVALVVSLAGIGGMLAFSVSQRTREIGLRLALGAERGGVLALVLGRGLRLVALGLALGIVGALAMARVMRGLVYGIAPNDPLTYAVVGVAVVVVALAACWIPARRATRIQPVIAFKGG